MIVLLAAATVLRPPPRRASADPTYYYEENFDGTALSPARWAIATNGYPDPAVSVGGGLLQMGRVGAASLDFPYVASVGQPFPSTGDFRIELTGQYTSATGKGDGVDVLGPNNEVVLQIWDDNSLGNTQAYLLGSGLAYISPGAHTYALDVRASGASFSVDGTLQLTGPPIPRPTKMWIGHPTIDELDGTYPGMIPQIDPATGKVLDRWWSDGPWTTFTLDAVRVSYLAAPQPWKLPYGPYDHVKWSGGPHQYGNTDFSGTFPFGQGSGLDFARDGNVSFPVRAIADGTVEATNTVCPYVQNGPLGYGCWVAVRHGMGGPVSIYAHLEPGSVPWNDGDPVLRGQILAYAGQSGNQPLIHLHLELREGNTDSTCASTANCWFGDPLDWHGIVIDGWQIHEYFTDGQGLTSYNYDGSATKGAVTVVPNFPYIDNGTRHPAAVVRVGFGFQCDYATANSCEVNAASPSDTQFATTLGGTLGAGGVSGGPPRAPEFGDADQAAELVSTNVPSSPSVGGIAEQPDASVLPWAAASGRDYTGYIFGAAVAIIVAAGGAVGWRRRRRKINV